MDKKKQAANRSCGDSRINYKIVLYMKDPIYTPAIYIGWSVGRWVWCPDTGVTSMISQKVRQFLQYWLLYISSECFDMYV